MAGNASSRDILLPEDGCWLLESSCLLLEDFGFDTNPPGTESSRMEEWFWLFEPRIRLVCEAAKEDVISFSCCLEVTGVKTGTTLPATKDDS